MYIYDMTPRRYNAAQKAALYLAADGRCSQCGAELEPGWHADHMNPYSRGGPTDVINGQALCPRCNLKKGVRMAGDDLRTWQRQAWEMHQARSAHDFLVVGTPGCGKTRFATHVARQELLSGTVDRVHVVCPSEHLKKQWKEDASAAGIELQADWRNADGAISSDFDGVVVTYQQVASTSDLHRRHCTLKRTLVILDEVHHAGVADHLAWGTAVVNAFGDAARRLCLSGTPFRSDGLRIPFITYDDDGYAVADFTYTYRQAQLDRVCRPVFFPKVGGSTEWLWNNNIHQATFDDELTEEESRRRLRTALSLDTAFMPQFLTDAHRTLTELRSGDDPTAGGLVIAIDQEHAEGISALFASHLGIMAPVATSDKPDSSQIISQYADGTEPWLIAVKMVSEGVDIPRLRVLVYATNVGTPTFFRQAVGRIVRRQKNGPKEQSAFCFIPDDPILRVRAEQIAEERVHALKDAEERAEEIVSELARQLSLFDADQDNRARGFQAVSADAEFAGIATPEGEVILADEYRLAEEQLRAVGGEVRSDLVAWIAQINRLNGVTTPDRSIPTQPKPAVPLEDRKGELRDIQNRLVRNHCLTNGQEFKVVNGALNRAVGIAKLRDATERQLIERYEFIKKLVAGAWETLD